MTQTASITSVGLEKIEELRSINIQHAAVRIICISCDFPFNVCYWISICGRCFEQKYN